MTIDAQKLREKAQKLVATKSFDEAIELYKTALETEPAPPDLWCELGSLQKSGGDLDGCGRSYYRAAEIYLDDGQDRYALAACQKAVQSGGIGPAIESARDLSRRLVDEIKAQKARAAASPAPPGPVPGGSAQSFLHQVASSGRVQLGEVRRLLASDYHEIDTTPLPPPHSALRPLRRKAVSDYDVEPTSELDVRDLEEDSPVGGVGAGRRVRPGAAPPPPPPVSYWDELKAGPKPKETRTPRRARPSHGIAAPKERFMVLSRRDAGTLLAGLRSGRSYGIPEEELGRIAREAARPEERVHDVLGRSLLFEGLAPDLLAEHASTDRLRAFESGEVLCATGSGGDRLLSLLSGTARVLTVSEPPLELATLRPGAIVGEQSFAGTLGMKARVVAGERVEAVALSRLQAEELMSDHPASLYAMLRVVEERVVDNMLQRAGFFSLFSPEERDQICPRFEILEVADDEVIVEQGTPSKTLCLLMSGIIELSHRNAMGSTVKMLLDPGGVFGEESLIDGRPQVFTARTTARSWIMLLRREDYLQIYERHPALVRSLKDVLRRRRRTLEQVNSGEIDLSAARWPDFDPSTVSEKQTRPTVDRGARKR